MIVGRVTKQPGERFPIAIDFTRRLPTGNIIQSATVTAKKRSDGADATATVLVGAVGITGGIVARDCVGGVTGIEYVVEFKATLDVGSRVLEDELLLAVLEVP